MGQGPRSGEDCSNRRAYSGLRKTCYSVLASSCHMRLQAHRPDSVQKFLRDAEIETKKQNLLSFKMPSKP